MIYKTCGKCKIEKSIKEFHKNKYYKDGLSFRCKQCAHKYNKERYNNLKEKFKNYYQINKQKILEKQKIKYNISNPKIKERYEKNKLKIILYQMNRYYPYKIKYPWKFTLQHIKQRCNNSNHTHYKYYGGRGIKCLITEEELKFLWFRDCAYELEQPSIHRIDNDSDYELNNCQYIEKSKNSKQRFLK